MFRKLMVWLGFTTAGTDQNPLVREALRTGRRKWKQPDGSTLELLSTDEELRMTPEQRWTRINAAAMARGCFWCHEPGRVVREHPVMGSVPYQVIACEKHAHEAN